MWSVLNKEKVQGKVLFQDSCARNLLPLKVSEKAADSLHRDLVGTRPNIISRIICSCSQAVALSLSAASV